MNADTVNVYGWRDSSGKAIVLEDGTPLTQQAIATVGTLPNECDGKSFPDTCTVTCNTGYTFSNEPYPRDKRPGQAVYTCVPKSGDYLAPTGEWWALNSKDGKAEPLPSKLATYTTNPWTGTSHPRSLANTPYPFIDGHTNDLQCKRA